jgi:hypothetical protein
MRRQLLGRSSDVTWRPACNGGTPDRASIRWLLSCVAQSVRGQWKWRGKKGRLPVETKGEWNQ